MIPLASLVALFVFSFGSPLHQGKIVHGTGPRYWFIIGPILTYLLGSVSHVFLPSSTPVELIISDPISSIDGILTYMLHDGLLTAFVTTMVAGRPA